MGGKKSESKNTTTTTNVGGTNAIHGDNLGVSVAGVNNSTMTITATDHGAVDKSLDFAESAAEFAMTSNAEVTGRALDSVDGAVDKAFGFGKDSLGVVESIAGSSIDQLGDKHSENLQMLAGLSGSQGEQNSQNIKAMMELAKMKADGGASLADKRVLWIAGIGFVSVAVLMYLLKGK